MIQIAIFDIDGLFLGITTLDYDQFNYIRDNIHKVIELNMKENTDAAQYKIVKLFNSFILIKIPKENEFYNKDTKHH